jgi:hypothetical protein
VPTEWGPVDFVDELLGVVESVGAECAEDEEALSSRTIAYTLLAHGRGAIDRHLGRIVAFYARALVKARTEHLISAATTALAAALQYNAGAALGALLAHGDGVAALNSVFTELNRVAALADAPGLARPIVAAQAGALGLACVMRAAAAGALPPPLAPQLGHVAALALRLTVVEGGWRLALETKRDTRRAEAEAAEAEGGATAAAADGGEEEDDEEGGGGGDDDGSLPEDDDVGGADDEEEDEDEFGELEGPQAHINTAMFFAASLRALYASPLRGAAEAALKEPALAQQLEGVLRHVAGLEAQGTPAAEICPPPME